MLLTEYYERHCEKYYRSYGKIEGFFNASPLRIKALNIFNKLSTVIVYMTYIFVLGYFAIGHDMRFFRVLGVPAVIFLVTTAVRSAINAPRPYEKYPIRSIVHKSTKGKSCPSRHSACAAAIAFACLYMSVPFGIAMLVLAMLIAVSRPVMGVHFPLDVLFGFALASVMGAAGFFLIP